MQWFPPICQNAKNSAPIVSRLKFSSSHVSFVSLATLLSLGTGPDPLHFRQKPSVFFTKQCTLSNLWEPARQNVTSLVLCSISISEKHFYRICSQIIFPLESRQIFKVMKYEHCTIYSVFRPFLSSRLWWFVFGTSRTKQILTDVAMLMSTWFQTFGGPWSILPFLVPSTLIHRWSDEHSTHSFKFHSFKLLTESSLATILLANLPGSPDPPAKCFVSVIVGFAI